ncbi:hypothetical protein [Yoonia sp. 2307UL14-13]|uniref:hypothetical protein n=1 Tax=Yoonia sp. 2307UL14-13 TaxID=3126506 RepID=UPI0030B4491C
MSPIKVIAQLFKVSPKIATMILAGVGLFAAAAIVLGFGFDMADLQLVAIYILIFATCVTVFTFILNDGRMRSTICWIVIVAFGGWTVGLFDSALQATGRLPSLPCYIRMPIEHPQMCEVRLAPTIAVVGEQQEARLTLPAIRGPERLWLAQADVTAQPANPHLTANTNIYLQFTPNVPRQRVVDLAANLTDLNWHIEGGDKGGEQVKAGPDRNEVRYFHPGDQAAAMALAQSLHALNPTAPVAVRDFTRLRRAAPDGQLEIWVNTIGPRLNPTN